MVLEDFRGEEIKKVNLSPFCKVHLIKAEQMPSAKWKIRQLNKIAPQERMERQGNGSFCE